MRSSRPFASALRVETLAHHPGLVDAAIVADHHDGEQHARGLVHRARPAAIGDQRLVPGLRGLAAIGIERDEISLLAGLEIAELVVDVEALGTAERDRPEAAIR